MDSYLATPLWCNPCFTIYIPLPLPSPAVERRTTDKLVPQNLRTSVKKRTFGTLREFECHPVIREKNLIIRSENMERRNTEPSSNYKLKRLPTNIGSLITASCTAHDAWRQMKAWQCKWRLLSTDVFQVSRNDVTVADGHVRRQSNRQVGKRKDKIRHVSYKKEN